MNSINMPISGSLGTKSSNFFLSYIKEDFMTTDSNAASATEKDNLFKDSHAERWENLSKNTKYVSEDNLESRLAITLDKFKRNISEVSMHLRDDWKTGLFAQLDSLIDFEEWDEDDLPPSEESFETFIRMLLVLEPSTRPGIGSTYDGKILAFWTKDNDSLTVECLHDDKIQWVLSYHSDDEMERAAGNCQIGRLRDVLMPYQASHWFENDK